MTEQIQAVLVKQKASELNAARGEELFAKLQAGSSLQDVAQELTLNVEQARDVKRNDYTLAPGMAKDVFQISHPSEGQPTVERITLVNGDVALVSLLAVKQAPTAELDPRAKENITVEQINRNYLVFVDALKQKAEVKAAATTVEAEQN